MSAIEEFFSEMRRKDESPSIPHEGMIYRMREYAGRYGVPCPFKAGDLVTARCGGMVRNEKVGEPCLVLDVFEQRIEWGGEQGTPEYGRRIDMRVAAFMSDSVVELCVNSTEYEPYAEPAAQAAE